MYTVHTMKSDLIKRRIHVAPVGFEIDRVVIPAINMEAHMVYLIVDQNVSRDKSTKFQDEIIKQLKKKKIDSKKIYADRLRLFENVRVVKEIISEHRKDDVWVNVASGSKIHAIACMMACMIFDDRTNIHPYYPEAKEYPSYNLEKQQTRGVKDIQKLPKYQLLTPNKELIEILKIIRENKGRIQKKELAEIAEEKSLIGFAGAPWTLLTYMITRTSPKKNKRFLKNFKKNEAVRIIKRLEHLIYIHCKEQILAGVDIIQLFDSWAGLINKKNFNEFCINPNKNIVNKIKKNFPNNPVICFPKGINKNMNNFIKVVNPHGISIDYNVSLKNLNLNNNVVFQGGMNPKFLLGNNKRMFKEAKKYLDFFKNKPYIFNLGHGILPKTKPENVKRLIEFVRSYSL